MPDPIILTGIIVSAVASLCTVGLNCFQSVKENHFNLNSPCCSFFMDTVNKDEVHNVHPVTATSSTEFRLESLEKQIDAHRLKISDAAAVDKAI